MVTKRARRWLARGAVTAVVALVATLGAAAWALSGTVASELYLSDPPDVVDVLGIDARGVTLAADARSGLPGIWGLVTETGRIVVGEIESAGGREIRRHLLGATGAIEGGAAALDRIVYGPDPGAVGVQFSEVILAGPGGEMATWVVAGRDDTWVVFIHDSGADRTEALRMLGALTALGLPVVIPALHAESDTTSGGHADLGPASSRQVTAAMDFALGSGAEEVVLIGSGTGASAVLLAAADERYDTAVRALVLDGPLLDAASIADERLRADKVPGFLVGWAKAVATFRFGVEWTVLDHVATAFRQFRPVLIFHGDRDTRFPVAPSRAYAAAAPDAMLIEVAQAGHGETWNLDPAGYEAALTAFLERTVVGPSGFGPQGS
jgi:pimeloyl-ACP methyl ester carboxylesterase